MRSPRVHEVTLCAALSLIACNKSSSPSGAASDKGAPATNSTIPALAFLEGFEGEIDAQFQKGDPASPATPVSALIKSGKFRFDIPEKLTADGEGAARFLGPKAYAIFDSAAKKTSIVSDSKKQVIVIDLNNSGERLKNFRMPDSNRPTMPTAKAPTEPEKKVTKTGKFETVAGRQCEDWEVSSDHREATVCVAHEGISWFSLPAAALPSEHAWALELMDGKHFPLKFVGYAKDGATENGRGEITKMEKKSIPDSEFEYPADYRVVDLAQLFQGMAGFPAMMAGNGPAGMGGATPAGAAAGLPPGMPSNLPGLTPEQMQMIQQRMQKAQQMRH